MDYSEFRKLDMNNGTFAAIRIFKFNKTRKIVTTLKEIKARP